MGEDVAAGASSGSGVGTQESSTCLAPERDRIAIVVNGRAKGVNTEVIAAIDRILSGGDLFVSRSLGEARTIARSIVERGYGTVLTGGGDGTFTVTVTETVRAARELGVALPRFGLLRLGTGNALAWVVGSGNGHGAWAADIQRLQRDAGSRQLRLVEVDGYLTPFCGFGADAELLMDYQAVRRSLANTPLARFGQGPMGYALATLTRTVPSHLMRGMSHCRVVNRGGDAFRLGARGSILGAPVPVGEVLYEGPARIVTASTIPYFGFGFRAFPYTEEREDRMQLRISTLGVRDFLENFRSIWKGEYDDPDVLFDYLVDRVSIEMDPASPFQIGGDVQGARAGAEIALSPEPIRLVDFYAPPSAS
jgi:diacylglycerol kinase family enzyme